MAIPKEAQVVGICGLFCKTCKFFIEDRCDGCLSDRIYADCIKCKHGFRECVAAHGVTWCSECADFPCKRLEDFKDIHVENGISHHEHIIEFVQRQHDIGPAAWAEEMTKLNSCPNCGEVAVWCEKTCRKCGAKVKD